MKKTVNVNIIERDAVARRKCTDYHGFQCKVCGFKFEEKYGEKGKKYIHVHHLVPLSKIKQEYKVNPKKDLIPICPNCHAMIHRHKNKPLTVEELKIIIEKNQY